MKKFLISIPFIVIALFVLILLNYTSDKFRVNPERLFKVKHEFHVKVQCFGTENAHWIIVFTNNNWLTQRTINDAFDLTPMGGKVWVCHQEHLFRSQEDAISFAKTMISFNKCTEYNQMIKARYDAYVQHWKDNPLPQQDKKSGPKKEVCKDIQVI